MSINRSSDWVGFLKVAHSSERLLQLPQEEVKIYAKLPKGFQIPPPVGNYTPDWAIVFREGSVKHIYFIAETKGNMSSLDLRPIEKAKISCAKRLFEKLSNGSVHYDHVDSYKSLHDMISF